MAIFGIASASQAITATDQADVVNFQVDTAVASANTVIALAGNDIINLAGIGRTAVASAKVSGNTFAVRSAGGSGTFRVSAGLVGSASYNTGRMFSAGLLSAGAGRFSGSVNLTAVLTAQQGARVLQGSQFYGNQGSDSIALGTQLTNVSATTIGGGDGSDVIGTYSNFNSVWTAGEANSAVVFNKSLIEAGGGNDTLLLDFSGTLTSSTVGGSQGNDLITISAAGAGVNSLIAGGGGNDAISASFSSFSGSSLYGGGGNDTIVFTAVSGSKFLIAGDAPGTSTTYDGSDFIRVNSTSASSITVEAGFGNDTLLLSGTFGGGNLFNVAAGNDSVVVTNVFSADTLQAGAGDDSIKFSAGLVSNALVMAGGGADSIFISRDATSAGIVAGTIFGGLGADVISSVAVSAGNTIGVTFGYSAYADSTLSEMDSIAIGGSAQSASYVLNFTQGGITLGSFSATGVSGSNGFVAFTAGFDNSLTARYEAINTGLTTDGAVVNFRDGSGRNYVFVQGGSTDFINRIGTATSAGGVNAVTIAGGKTVTVNLV